MVMGVGMLGYMLSILATAMIESKMMENRGMNAVKRSDHIVICTFSTLEQTLEIIQEIRKAETNAQLVAENVATQLERRIAFRRAMKRAMSTAMKFGAKGVRIHAAGRLGGAELSRREGYKEGKVPLHTLRANVEYGFSEANTVAGTIGVKVWICREPEEADAKESSHASYA